MRTSAAAPGLAEHHYDSRPFFQPGSPPVYAVAFRDYAIEAHTHEFIEINFVLAGRGEHELRGARSPAARGDVFVIPPGCAHGYPRGRRLHVYHLLLAPAFLEHHKPQLFTVPGFLQLFTVEPYLRGKSALRHGLHLDAARLKQTRMLLEALQRELAAARGWDLGIVSLTLYLVRVLCRWYTALTLDGEAPVVRHPQMAALQAAFDLVAARYPEKLELQDLAEAAHLERSSFCRLFRSVTGLTPMDYLTHYRIQAARALLLETEKSITEIAQEAGFYDSAHFSRTFSKVTGMPPSRFRRP